MIGAQPIVATARDQMASPKALHEAIVVAIGRSCLFIRNRSAAEKRLVPGRPSSAEASFCEAVVYDDMQTEV